MENLVSQLPAVNRSLERLSTQTDYEGISLEEAASSVRECSEIQNNGSLLKHGFRRRLGALIGALEETEGVKARKKVAADLKIPFVEVKKAVNEASVSKEDYDRYVQNVLRKNKEITDAGALRAGKEAKKPRLVSAALRVSEKLGVWVDSLLINSLVKEYAGSKEELRQASEILEKLSTQFSKIAEEIRKGL